MAAFPKRPEGIEEWTVPINFLNDATVQERMDYFRANATGLVDLFRRFPDAVDGYVAKYGQAFVDELYSLAS